MQHARMWRVPMLLLLVMLLGDGLCSLQEVVHNDTLLCEGSCLLDAAQQRRRHRDRTEVVLGPF